MPSGPRSIQHRVLAAVLSLLLLGWGFAAAMTWRDTHHEVSELLDAHLAQAASLLGLHPLEELSERSHDTARELHRYQPRVAFQVWQGDTLMARSANAPEQSLAPGQSNGFFDTRVGNDEWRVFVIRGHEENTVLMVGELEWFRNDVVMASLRSVLWPIVFVLPLMLLGVWWAVHGAVRPLHALSRAVAQRSPQSLQALAVADAPPEVQPLIAGLNHLFERIRDLLQAEQQFTADAAHELRTPIAGIRMQAQVAQGATTDADRQMALRATVEGCDRATRVIEQLLLLARLDAETGGPAEAHCNLAAVAAQVAADLAPQAAQRQQTVQWTASGSTAALAPLSEPLARVLVRNLIDNALRYSPDGASVHVQFNAESPGGPSLTIEDSGPGMPPQALARLGERFFRVLGSGQSGSGLGWSIVHRLARLHGLQVQADQSPTLGGLRATVRWRTKCAPGVSAAVPARPWPAQ